MWNNDNNRAVNNVFCRMTWKIVEDSVIIIIITIIIIADNVLSASRYEV